MENRNARLEDRVFGNDTTDSHERSIVHIDIDCFYAQVEMVRNPELRSRPLGIQQKNIVVTSNYEARAFGIEKCMPVAEALRLCPALVLVRGEDLQPYRRMSAQIFSELQSYGCPVERLGMDENFIDVTALVGPGLAEEWSGGSPTAAGHVYGGEELGDEGCRCGCRERLAAASRLAADMRRKLRERLRITCCAGVGHNKLLAKLATPLHKPDQQTLVPPSRAASLLAHLPDVRSIPGVGLKTAEALAALGLCTVSQLQAAEPRILATTFSVDMAARLRGLSLGVDRTQVKASGAPASLGLEDSCRALSLESEVRERFAALLRRLLALLGADPRRPGGLRVTLRQHAPPRTPARASRHANLPPSLLGPSPEAHARLMDLVMRLFRKMVDLSKPFRLTLLGLAFTKFQEVVQGRGAVSGYLMSDMAVQAVLHLEHEAEPGPALPPAPAPPPEPPEREPEPKKVRVGDLRLSCLRLSTPPEVDPQVFGELPPEVQRELRSSWGLDSGGGGKANTITRYFIPNKQ